MTVELTTTTLSDDNAFDFVKNWAFDDGSASVGYSRVRPDGVYVSVEFDETRTSVYLSDVGHKHGMHFDFPAMANKRIHNAKHLLKLVEKTFNRHPRTKSGIRAVAQVLKIAGIKQITYNVVGANEWIDFL